MTTDPTTRRAEQIREETGCAWEYACRQAEQERDTLEQLTPEQRDTFAYFIGHDEVTRVMLDDFIASDGSIILESRMVTEPEWANVYTLRADGTTRIH